MILALITNASFIAVIQLTYWLDEYVRELCAGWGR